MQECGKILLIKKRRKAPNLMACTLEYGEIEKTLLHILREQNSVDNAGEIQYHTAKNKSYTHKQMMQ